jgi:hypothetical protein
MVFLSSKQPYQCKASCETVFWSVYYAFCKHFLKKRVLRFLTFASHRIKGLLWEWYHQIPWSLLHVQVLRNTCCLYSNILCNCPWKVFRCPNGGSGKVGGGYEIQAQLRLCFALASAYKRHCTCLIIDFTMLNYFRCCPIVRIAHLNTHYACCCTYAHPNQHASQIPLSSLYKCMYVCMCSIQ